MYERAAIEAHLAGSTIDPMTAQTISDQLTPVFLLKSRAMEYAEAAIQVCLQRTLSPGCREPARWLRRAVDLCEESGKGVEG